VSGASESEGRFLVDVNIEIYFSDDDSSPSELEVKGGGA